MSGNRFRIQCDDVNSWSVWEYGEVIVFDLFKCDAEVVCEKLNQLYEENNSLRNKKRNGKEFTVGDLIEELKKLPKELPVELGVSYDNCEHIQPLSQISFYEGIGWITLEGSKQ